MYYVYITTNPKRTTFYTGVTNDLIRRLIEHKLNRGKKATFAGRYFCYKLVFFESYEFIEDAIIREKQIKDMSRQDKIELIKIKNPQLKFIFL
jgi:putative endonuclease